MTKLFLNKFLKLRVLRGKIDFYFNFIYNDGNKNALQKTEANGIGYSPDL